ncbi:MAG: MalY/PatB family protein [Caldicoprobacterales bacterium]|jgi:cystathionine beta-lyase|nr:pyridoxal phosphate-dependent aminotransferase [Clostridiales bacterium]
MKYNFDEIIERKGTNSVKYDISRNRSKSEDIIPLWVADMDFRTLPAVVDELVKAARHGIFGYTSINENYFKAVHNWYKNRFDWTTEPSWLVPVPGVVDAIAISIRALTNEGDAVLIQRPVYYPFTKIITQNKRKLINSPLLLKEGRYEMDFDDIEYKIKKENVKLFILCSPHNPVGRVWTKEELLRVGEICMKYNVTVISDEIHCDFVYKGNKHYVFGSIKPEFLDNSIICTAPSKTFNLAGLRTSNIFIKNKNMRNKFIAEIENSGMSQPNTMGLIACQAAYEHGEEWLKQLIEYLENNIKFIKDYLHTYIPNINLIELEGTYLIWLDFRKLNKTEEELEDIIFNKAGILLNKGTIFGEEGRGFQRMIIACPKSVLEQAFIRLEMAINGRIP